MDESEQARGTAMDQTIGVIGSGLGGLTAACVLAARGCRVSVFEKNAWLGGKAAVLCDRGFRFDMGPTILIFPSVLRRIFSEAGRNMEDYLKLVRLDPQWRCFFEDGSCLNLFGDQARMQEELNRYAPDTVAGYRRFVSTSEELHAISNRFFFWRSLGSMRDTFKAGSALNLSLLHDVSRMKLGQTVAGTIRHEIKDSRVAQMLDHLTQYVGSSPEKSPAILCAIAHMQASEGVWYPIGGTRAIPEALIRLARELGVEFRTSTGVARIDVKGGAVHGVETSEGKYVALNALIANSDSVRTYRELIGGRMAQDFDRRRSYEPACSGVVMYLGLNRRYENLAHHTFVFSRDPREEFRAIYEKGELAPDPTCYLCAPSCTEPAVAPHGGEALYVLVHTPYLRTGQDWSTIYPEYRKVIIEKLKRTAKLEGIEDAIVSEHHLTPQDIEDRYGVWKGAIYGLASHGRFQGGFKPSNHDPNIVGLYLAGGSAHPGPGMPMVMMSGWIAADKLDRDGVATTAQASFQATVSS